MNNNRTDQCYKSKDNAKLVNGSDLRKNYDEDLCLRYFYAEYNHDGY